MILPVKHFQQRREGECLAACAAMVLGYLGASIPYQRLLTLLEIQSDVGTPSFKVRNLVRIKIAVDYRRGTIEQLQAHLLANQPCIVFVRTGDLQYRNDNTDHALVLIGIDDKYVYVNDPEFVESPYRELIGNFDLAWLERDEMYAVLTR